MAAAAPAPPRYRVGIDLGTSNTVVAYAEAATSDARDPVQLLPIPQLVALGAVAAREHLPSLRYHPARGELRPQDITLPWSDPEEPLVIGALARQLGTQVPGRVVASAKSWLSHGGVDRSAPILPWTGSDDVPKVSPLEASASYLATVHMAWNTHFPDDPLDQQAVSLTVPASFDEAARALTLQAAEMAGLPGVRLLEEPQAAFHDWLFRHRESLATALADVRLVLVCDIGGGTTDLTLIHVAPGDAEPRLTRIGVGRHLMLGGDNMDLALARQVEGQLADDSMRLSASRFALLLERCRDAKERLLAADAPDSVTLTLPGAGGRLVAGARSVELSRASVEALLVDGFLPRVAIDEPLRRARSGLVEFGLPYPADAAISRHLADFLRRHADVARDALGDRAPADGPPVPDAVLLNGGVFRADALVQRLLALLADWRGAAPRVLHNRDPDIAVARGAVAASLLSQGGGPRIEGGAARSYFLRLQGAPTGEDALCLLPRGTPEGREQRLTGRRFALRLGEPVRFELAASSIDRHHRCGELCPATDDWEPLPPLATVLEAPAGLDRSELVVEIAATMSEIGTLQVECIDIGDATRRWQLEFQMRAAPQASPVEAAAPPRNLDAALEAIDVVFGAPSGQVTAGAARQLRGQLERLLGPREDWDLAVLRTLFDALMARARRRRRSAEHERAWLNLAGFCLRPGSGEALDPWRAECLWPVFAEGLQYRTESQNATEWWTLWRRAAAGLDDTRQLAVLDILAGPLQRASMARASGSDRAAFDDLLRLAATLERVPVERKLALGTRLLAMLKRPGARPLGWWALGRIGARQLMYGSGHHVVPPEIAAEWLARVLALDWRRVAPAAFAACQLARLSGDRGRDLPEALRETVVARLAQIRAPAEWIAPLRELQPLQSAEARLAYGESLPIGLRLLSAVQD